MTISLFDLFSIGIGPSSSHTVGPMKAANEFAGNLKQQAHLSQTKRISVELFGSLAFTGVGHGTDSAILMGLQAYHPSTIDPDIIQPQSQIIRQENVLKLANECCIPFHYEQDFIFNYQDLLPAHSNGMRFTAYADNQTVLQTADYYSIGGGFILDAAKLNHPQTANEVQVPYPFTSAKTLLELCLKHQLSIHELMLKNECAWRSQQEVEEKLFKIADAMHACIEKGCQTPGILPGGLNIKRRAPELFKKLSARGKPSSYEHSHSIEWLNLYAIAVNEENANGGRVVTAPTNGAAGIIPAVLEFYLTFYPQASRADTLIYLLTAGAMAILYKKGASISGAEVGCQGEVGVACSMAAAGLTALLGGNLQQIENAAEIAMEHHLGMTCDPIKGLVQIPCIERNAMGAVKAINATRLALLGDGEHYVSLDKVIATMHQTGKDMMAIYKETSLGGLAANLPEC